MFSPTQRKKVCAMEANGKSIFKPPAKSPYAKCVYCSLMLLIERNRDEICGFKVVEEEGKKYWRPWSDTCGYWGASHLPGDFADCDYCRQGAFPNIR
jgi:hypothetical protein